MRPAIGLVGLEDACRIETGQNHIGPVRRHGPEFGDRPTADMVHRHGIHTDAPIAHPSALEDKGGLVHYPFVVQQRTFRESGRSGRVLDLDWIGGRDVG